MTLAVAGALLWSSVASAQVRLTMSDGQVSLSAQNATLSQILAEWARVGQTRVVNAERAPGAPLTIELTDVPEAQALDIILRSASGYLLAPRANPVASASRFDRILIVPASSATGAAATPGVASPAPSFVQPRFSPQPPQPDDFQPDDPDAGDPSVRVPAFSPFPQPNGVGQPDQPLEKDDVPAPPPAPEAPVGVSRPGMVVPTPSPGRQPGSPQP